MRAVATIIETIDPSGRYLKKEEARWLLSEPWKDRLSPIRLSIALSLVTGIRIHDAVHAKRKDFNKDFTYYHARQCKASVRQKDGITRVRIKPRMAQIPSWLALDLRNYDLYRCRLAEAHSFKNPERLWPCLHRQSVYSWFWKLRKRYGNTHPWLLDIWYREGRLYSDGTTKYREIHRIAPHMGRATFCQQALIIAEGDLNKCRLLSGHERIKDTERYLKGIQVQNLRERLSDEIFSNYSREQKTPVLIGQKSLKSYM